MKIKQRTKRFYYLISVAIVTAVIAFSYYNETKDPRTFVQCEYGFSGSKLDSGLYAFDEKYFYHGYIANTGEFIYKKFAQDFNQIEATYNGVINEEGNETSVYIDRVEGKIIFYLSNSEKGKRPYSNCEKIKKPKITKIPTKF